ncbi:hypothetical protein [Burkholderia stabilis]|uniref:hypothetical protein n=1 Tax=Burkholderia stabilis TaxID=95485 RepID=UPI001FC7DCB9|nr:hypothetical protein [Burkholderia stabilis]
MSAALSCERCVLAATSPRVSSGSATAAAPDAAADAATRIKCRVIGVCRVIAAPY